MAMQAPSSTDIDHLELLRAIAHWWLDFDRSPPPIGPDEMIEAIKQAVDEIDAARLREATLLVPETDSEAALQHLDQALELAAEAVLVQVESTLDLSPQLRRQWRAHLHRQLSENVYSYIEGIAERAGAVS